MNMLFAAATVICVSLASTTVLAEASLRFVDEVFKIVQFTDLHLGEGKSADEATVRVRVE